MPTVIVTPKPAIGRDLPYGSERLNQDHMPPRTRRGALARPGCELLVTVFLCLLICRTFLVEAYIVPTGSMATTLLGTHRDVTCPGCRIHFAVGVDESGAAGPLLCPNCGHTNFARAAIHDSTGDRLIVQKYVYSFRKPRRWEVVVFENPETPGEAYVKRVVGLPGERVRLRDGDVWINDQRVRKSLAEQRALRVLVYDQNHPPPDALHFPRWLTRRGSHEQALESGWNALGNAFQRKPAPCADGNPIDWLEYHHWEPDRQAPGPVRDFVAYNGIGAGGEHRVDDLMLETQLAFRPNVPSLHLRLEHAATRFVVTIPISSGTTITVDQNGTRSQLPARTPALIASPPSAPRWHRIEASVIDQALLVAIDGQPLFDPIPFDNASSRPRAPSSPLAIGVPEGEAEVRDLKIFRDVYYTPALAGSMRQPHAVNTPVTLEADQYFVLGDNSPVSNDSRFWPRGPVVQAARLVGKPFLVHLPSQMIPLHLWGPARVWIPDFRQIRYIH